MPTSRRRQRDLIRKLLRRFEPEIARAFAESVQDLRAGVNMAALERAIGSGNVDAVIRALRLDAAALSPITSAIQSSYQASGAVTASSISNITNPRTNSKLFVRFDLRNPRAERWVRDHSAKLVTDIITDQRSAIRLAVEAAVRDGNNPRSAALDIIGRINKATGRREGGIIGLTSNQTQWADNAFEELSSTSKTALNKYLGRKARDRRFDAAVRKAIDTGEPVPRATVQRAIARYKDNLLQLRGEAVARTEALNSMRAARKEAFEQAADSGEISKTAIKRRWNSTGDDGRTRDDHLAMDNHPPVGLDEPYTFPDGSRAMFPGDDSLGAPGEQVIQCRCTEDYEIDFFEGVT
jgi:hypothetical protein